MRDIRPPGRVKGAEDEGEEAKDNQDGDDGEGPVKKHHRAECEDGAGERRVPRVEPPGWTKVREDR